MPPQCFTLLLGIYCISFFCAHFWNTCSTKIFVVMFLSKNSTNYYFWELVNNAELSWWISSSTFCVKSSFRTVGLPNRSPSFITIIFAHFYHSLHPHRKLEQAAGDARRTFYFKNRIIERTSILSWIRWFFTKYSLTLRGESCPVEIKVFQWCLQL